MDRSAGAVHLLILLSGVCFLQVVRGGSVVFLDGYESKYFRSPSEIKEEVNSVSVLEIVATSSVLLGVAPPLSLPSKSSTKLDRILRPNPFSKPRAVVILEVQGIKDSLFDHDSILVDDDTWSTKIIGSKNAQVKLSGDDDVNHILLDESIEYNLAGVDRDFENLAIWMGGSYVESTGSHDAVLEFPLPSGSSLKLHTSKEEDRLFALSLVSLVNGVKVAIEMREDLDRTNQRPVDLLTGYFTGVKNLGTTEISGQRLELFYVALNKLFVSLQKAYKGELVGIILVNDDEDVVGPSVGVERLQQTFRSGRGLEEILQSNTIIAEVILVRTTLAWVTGVILLLSALIGIYYLLYMPFTRDTLLYSNVKFD